MGADQSAFSQPLTPQSNDPICATEPRFCLPHTVQLRLREKLWSFSGDDFKITDASNAEIVYFQCHGKVFSLRDKKVLRDNMGVPVLNMKEQLISFTDKFRVYAGEGSDREICKFNSRLTFLKAKLVSHFNDVVTGRPRVVTLKGDWREKRCAIYLGEPKHGGIPIAKIFRPLTGRSLMFGVNDYIVEIAAGVDIALAVIMCIALDEHSRDGD
ncbi:protein LURP-one-related 15 [Folsomia candida]|uniref:Protein LURP-one-related 15 n=1 Tax=Folsomia candida TaxID=158441 RepID=A0A226DYQ7_FOLCA|nr:protein LURP-one-related 15 [Folsomia candida]OXA50423.1 Protein LURP-one-related 15 [Folsomia candida]